MFSYVENLQAHRWQHNLSSFSRPVSEGRGAIGELLLTQKTGDNTINQLQLPGFQVNQAQISNEVLFRLHIYSFWVFLASCIVLFRILSRCKSRHAQYSFQVSTRFWRQWTSTTDNTCCPLSQWVTVLKTCQKWAHQPLLSLLCSKLQISSDSDKSWTQPVYIERLDSKFKSVTKMSENVLLTVCESGLGGMDGTQITHWTQFLMSSSFQFWSIYFDGATSQCLHY